MIYLPASSSKARNEKCILLLGADIDVWFRSVIKNPLIDFNVAQDGEFSLNCLIVLLRQLCIV